MKLKGFILALGIMVVSLTVNAQSAVYFDRTNGAVGYAYGNNRANYNAYNYAISGGAIAPVIVIQTNRKGYGAIILARNASGGFVIGATAGYSTFEEATYFADLTATQNGGIQSTKWLLATWLDD
jgi:hypothetical protein